jgi:hypothetical protein
MKRKKGYAFTRRMSRPATAYKLDPRSTTVLLSPPRHVSGLPENISKTCAIAYSL